MREIKVKEIEPATVLDGGFPPVLRRLPWKYVSVFPAVVSLPKQKSARPKLLRTPAEQFSRDLCRGGGRFTGCKSTTTQAKSPEKGSRERRGFDSLHLKLGFGLMRLPLNSANGADIDMEQFKKMVDLFLERGFTYFDTSYVYHNGASETAIREALVKRHPRDSFLLVSKFPTFQMPAEDKVEDVFNEQLEKCGVEYFDYYLLHNLNRYLYPAEVKACHLFDYMKKWKEQGKIRRIAFSYHDDAEHLDQILTEHPEVDAVQIVLNYYDWEEPFIRSKKCYEVIVGHGKQVIVMEPVKGGALARVPAGAEHLLKGVDPHASPASFAIRFAASREGVLAVLSGMSNLKQVEENTGFMQNFKPVSEAEERALKEVKAAYQRTWKYQCDNWAALDDNAYGVPISGIIRAYNSMFIQPDPFFSAELNYYKSFRSAYDLAFETGDYSAQTAKIGGAFDVTAALKEAVKTQFENSFQSYMD